MTAAEVALWQKIESFELDDGQSGFTFSQRLARENGWNADYTQRVIQEYKRFIFLCCISPQGITPSDPVDQAWHLHLTYTKSYWINFCQHTLNQEVHHHPTKGGSQEAKKFDNYYTYSFNLYTEKFGTEPPADIWQDNQTRFSDIDFQRVNLNAYVLVKRSKFNSFKVISYVVIGIILLVAYLIVIDAQPDLKFPLLAFVFISAIIYNSRNHDNNHKNNDSGCGGDGFGGDDSSSHGHNSHGHSGCGNHGCSSGCSGCSGSGCSGCGGGGD